jgi:tetratricopeptide (TPR) repeat protein
MALFLADVYVLNPSARSAWMAGLPEGVLRASAAVLPGDGAVRYALGRRQRAAGDTVGAAASLEKAAALTPGLTAARAELADLLIDRGQTGRAYELAVRCLAEDVSSAPALVAMGRLHFLRSEWEKAGWYADAAVKSAPGSARAWLLSSQLCESRSQWTEAEQAAVRCVALEPRLAAGWAQRSAMALRLDRTAESVRCAERALALEPFSGRANRCLGEALLARAAEGDAERAEAAFRGAVAADPGDGEAQLGLGRALAALRRWHEARPQLALVAERWPKLNAARSLLGQACERLGDLDEARQWLRESRRWEAFLVRKERLEMALGGRKYDPQIHFELAKLCARMDLWDEGMYHADRGMRQISQPSALEFVRRLERARAASDPKARARALDEIELSATS